MCAPEVDDEKKTNFTRGGGVTPPANTADSNNRRPSSPPTPQPSSPPTAPLQVKNSNTASSIPGFTTTTRTTSTVPSSSRRVLRRQSSSVVEVGFHLTIGSVMSYLTVLFSLYFPFILAPWAASQTYHNASFAYDADLSHFDNTIWTYGTDYLLAICMFFLAKSINSKTPTPSSSSSFIVEDDIVIIGRGHHKWWSRGLLYSYMLSVLAGGLAHQFYLTPESQNSISFRILWTLCVGTVTAASGFMGAIGSELVQQDTAIVSTTMLLYRKQRHGRHVSPPQAMINNNNNNKMFLPNIPKVFWISFGILATCIVITGGFSFQRPACDIFIAGITQFPSTFYLMYIFTFGLRTSIPNIQSWARVVGVIGFILNAPLLPMYPLLVQYTNWTLGTVNTLLHTWLLVAWTMQGIALRHVGQALQVVAQDLHQQLQQDDEQQQLSGGSVSAALATAKVDKPKVS